MGTSTLPYRYKVNGLIDTSKTVMQNLELIANSCATWITYDIMDGKWSVVINRAGDPVHAFDDSNIIGGINLSGTGLNDFYNSVEVKFPHRDLADQMDWIKIEIPGSDRNVNEPDNCLTMELPVMNEPIQAQIVGLIELKQSRLDKIITLRTDYSKINLQAGQIITVTNSVYGFTNKEFRIIRMEEADVDGTIVIDITALEYNDSIYDLSDLYRYTRTNADGLITKGQIGKPSQPIITKFEKDPNPRIEIASDVPDGTDPLNPAGIVEGMEFWLSSDGTNYTLLNTLKPAAANVFEGGDTVTLVYNCCDSGNLYVKTRCVNSSTAGLYSNPTQTPFTPEQTTDAINNSTKAVDANGDVLNTLGLAGLLKLLDNLIAGNNASAAGGIYDKYNSTYAAVNGISLAGQAVMISNGIVSEKNLPCEPNTVETEIWRSPNFPAIQSGQFKLDVIVDQNTSGAVGGENDIISVLFKVINITTNTQVTFVSSGGPGSWYWNDYAMTDLITLTKDNLYQFRLLVRNDCAIRDPASFDLGVSLYTFVQSF